MPRRTVKAFPAAKGDKFERQLRHLIAGMKNTHGFAGRYLAEEAFSKYLDDQLVSPRQRKHAAVKKFLAAERRNGKTNERLYWDAPELGWVSYGVLVSKMKHIIADVLGPLPYPSVLQRATYTNGASTRVPRSPAASVVKLTGEVHITETALKHWFAMAQNTRLSNQSLKVVEGSVLFTVPKKTEIDRCACKEPEGNMLLQRSVGIYMRDRLRRVGIDLRDQSRNRDLARRAYNEGLATLDLSSASDTVSEQLVTLLLPPDWCWLLDDLRVKQTSIKGVTVALRMFSSMGNGFTFELETLLFYAIARAVAWLTGIKGPISIYGDDIICPAEMAPRLMRVLAWFGFVPNLAKTHYKGPFRESCGGHYWKGQDVTPFYLRGPVRTYQALINTLNHLLEWDGRGFGFFTTEEVAWFWQAWKDFVPRSLWGGISPDDPTCLVTGDAPRKRIVAEYRQLEVDQDAATTSWLFQADRSSARDDALEVKPAVERRFVYAPVVSAGVRTSYTPMLTWDTPTVRIGGRWGP